MPTATWPGHWLAGGLDQARLLTATVPRMTRWTPASNHWAMLSMVRMPPPSWAGTVDRREDALDGRAVDRMALDRAVEVDQMQPFAAGIGEGLGLGGRAVVEHRGARSCRRAAGARTCRP